MNVYAGRGGMTRGELVVGYLFLAVMAATGLPTPLYPLYRQRLGLSSVDITAVYGVYAIVVLVVLLVAGGLSDQIGRRRVLAIAEAAAASASSCCWLRQRWLACTRGGC